MNDESSDRSEYIHGSSPQEQQRLSLLNDLLNEACLQQLNLRPGEKVLDLGSGLGQFTRLMARAVGRAGQVVGIERDQDQLSQAEKLAGDSGESELVDFRRGDALSLPLSESEWASFDVCHARFLLEHIPRPASVISQMVRSVRPGGRVVVIDDDHGNFIPWPEPAGFNALWNAYVRSYDRLGNDPYVGRRLVALLHDGGLTSIRNDCVFRGLRGQRSIRGNRGQPDRRAEGSQRRHGISRDARRRVVRDRYGRTVPVEASGFVCFVVHGVLRGGDSARLIDRLAGVDSELDWLYRVGINPALQTYTSNQELAAY